MALTALYCEGYRAFSAPTLMPMSALNIVFGKNNCGKTSLVRLPIFAAASLVNDDLFALSSGGLRFGRSFVDVANGRQPHPRMRFAIAWDQTDIFGVELQHVTVNMEQEVVRARLLYLDGEQYDVALRVEDRRSPYRQAARAVDKALRSRLYKHRLHLEALLDSTVHVPSGRHQIKSTYELRDPIGWEIGEIPYLLAKHRELMDSLSSWFEESFGGIRLVLDQAGFAFRLVEFDDLPLASVSESGRGIQSVLPVAAVLLASVTQLKRHDLIVVEEPEEHLHPSAHGAVADLLIEASAVSQVFVETHSENLILRVRRRIAEGVLSPDDVVLAFVDDAQSVRRIELDEFGNTHDWPAGVFETDVEEAQVIVSAKIASIESAEQR